LEPWYRPFLRALSYGSYVLAHVGVALLLISGIRAIQWLVISTGDPKLFDFLPLRWVFDVMDLGILSTFTVFGTLEAIDVFGKRDQS
jgi:hypothetical protein